MYARAEPDSGNKTQQRVSLSWLGIDILPKEHNDPGGNADLYKHEQPANTDGFGGWQGCRGFKNHPRQRCALAEPQHVDADGRRDAIQRVAEQRKQADHPGCRRRRRSQFSEAHPADGG